MPGEPAVPAQFGNWATKANLNSSYDRAAPDVVLVSLGANDLGLTTVLTSCVLGVFANPNTCTSQDPGATINSLVLDQLPTLEQHHRDLVSAIQARGRSARPSKVPFVMFTDYPDPFPGPNANISFSACPDTGSLRAGQIAYLSSLLRLQRQTLDSAVRGMRGVSVADTSGVLAGHEWCSSDPWAYGLSTLALNLKSQAPVHPTARGQQAIAQVVLRTLPSNPTG
jgi:hypothetical protein